MPNVRINNVTLAFTQNMERESDFGGYNYSFIINKNKWCEIVRNALMTQKNKLWADSKNTDEFILQKTGARVKSDINYSGVMDMMKDDDVLVQVKSKQSAIKNTKGLSLFRGTTANIVVDVFEFEYMRKQFICVKAHPDRGCTVQPINVVETTSIYFEEEPPTETLINADAVFTKPDEEPFTPPF